MNPTQNQEQIDPTALQLKRAIFKAEGGNYHDFSGDAGTSAGAGQWNNGKIPLKKGEVPANFRSAATEFGLDPNDFSETAQDHVGYLQIKKDLDSGLTQSQVAAKWNSGLTHGWENHRGTVTINGKSITYDTPGYVNRVKNYYGEQQGYQPSSSPSQEYITSSNLPTPPPKADTTYKADNVTGILPKIAMGLGSLTGTKALGQGLGYAISNAMGSQDDVIKANQDAMDIQTQLIKTIRERKAQGRDTTKLMEALKNLSEQIKSTGANIEDIGTGGLTDSDILKSAGQTALTVATLPSLVKGVGSLVGGSKVMSSPAIESAAAKFRMPMDEFQALSNAEKLNVLTEATKVGVSASDKLVLEKAIQEITPSVIKELGIGTFSQRFPMITRTGKLLGKLAKGAGGLAVAAGTGAAVSNFYNKLTK